MLESDCKDFTGWRPRTPYIVPCRARLR